MTTKKKSAAKPANKPAPKSRKTKPTNGSQEPKTGQAWERGESVKCAPNQPDPLAE